MRLDTYLTFDGNCKAAMSFYRECLGGELKVQLVGDSPMASQMPDQGDKVMHSELKSEDFRIMASDMMGPGGIKRGNAMSLCINGVDAGELKRLFTALSKGGTVKTQLKEEFFGTYGDLVDKFGVAWMFQSDAK